MSDAHWFDTLHKDLMRSWSRREAVRSLVVMLPGLLLDPRDTEAENKHGGKKKSKRPDRCGRAECAATWPRDKDNRDACELKCGRCRIRKKFCIVERDPTDPAKVATCCHRHQTCCPTSDGISSCVDMQTDRSHCGQCGNACAVNEICLDGDCLCAVNCCPSGQELCAGRCVNTQIDRTNCGGCGLACAEGQWCEGAECRGCGTGPGCCSGMFTDYCVDGNGLGNCRDTRTDVNHCGACNNRCLQFEQCVSGQCV